MVFSKRAALRLNGSTIMTQRLTAVELRDLIQKLGISPRDLLRKGEQAYRDLKLKDRELSDDELIDIMVENPDLIQRPIVVRGNKAVLGRPPENVQELL